VSDRLPIPRDPESRAEAARWAGLGIAALALAGGLALLLALARTPHVQDLLPWPWESFFPKALVSHVVLSVVVWFLALLGLLTTLAADGLGGGGPGRLARQGTGLAGAACALLVMPALLDLGAPSLNNYVPVLDTPAYLAGLVLLALAVALPCLRLLSRLSVQALGDPLVVTAAAAAATFLIALACFAQGAATAPVGGERRDLFEWMFWGGGHVLQIVNALLLVGAWGVLARAAGLGPVLPPRALALAVALPVLAALAAPLLPLVTDRASGGTYRAYTTLYLVGLAPPLTLLGLAMVRRAWLGRARLSLRDPAGAALVLSLALFGLGGLLGFLVGQGDTRTPAHYHASIGGVNLALMGLLLVLVPGLLGKALRAGRSRWLLLWLYGGGQGLHALGLFLAGTAGVARKTAGADQALDSLWKTASMGVMGLGGLVAVVGGVMFILAAGRDAWGRDTKQKEGSQGGPRTREETRSCPGDST
jgi:hypothetical protein